MNAFLTGKTVLNGDANNDNVAGYLDRVDPETAAWRRLVFGGRADIRVHLGGTPYRVRFLADAALESPMAAWCIQIGTARGWLALEAFDIPGLASSEIVESLDRAFVHALLAEEAEAPLAQLIG